MKCELDDVLALFTFMLCGMAWQDKMTHFVTFYHVLNSFFWNTSSCSSFNCCLPFLFSILKLSFISFAKFHAYDSIFHGYNLLSYAIVWTYSRLTMSYFVTKSLFIPIAENLIIFACWLGWMLEIYVAKLWLLFYLTNVCILCLYLSPPVPSYPRSLFRSLFTCERTLICIVLHMYRLLCFIWHKVYQLVRIIHYYDM